MKRRFLIFIIFFFSAVIQTSFLPKIFSQEFIPNLVLAVVIIWSARNRFGDFWAWAFLAGFILDIMSFNNLGIHSLSFLIISFATGYFSRRLVVSRKIGSFFIILMFIFVGAAFNEIFTIIIVKFAYLLRERSYLNTMRLSDPGILYRAMGSAILGWTIYKPVNFLQKKLAKN